MSRHVLGCCISKLQVVGERGSVHIGASRAEDQHLEGAVGVANLSGGSGSRDSSSGDRKGEGS